MHVYEYEAAARWPAGHQGLLFEFQREKNRTEKSRPGQGLGISRFAWDRPQESAYSLSFRPQHCPYITLISVKDFVKGRPKNRLGQQVQTKHTQDLISWFIRSIFDSWFQSAIIKIHPDEFWQIGVTQLGTLWILHCLSVVCFVCQSTSGNHSAPTNGWATGWNHSTLRPFPQTCPKRQCPGRFSG